MTPVYSVSKTIRYGNEYVVEIYINGSFWDHRSFTSELEAENFRADPLRADRPKGPRYTEVDRSYIALGTRISKGRRINPKPSAA